MISQNALHHAEKCRFCWMCRHLCPVQHQTGKELNTPRAKGLLLSMVNKKAQEFDKDMGQAMYECLLCDACTNDCATGYQPPLFIREARTEAVVSEVAPESVMNLIENVETTGNIYGVEKPSYGQDGTDVLVYIGEVAAIKVPEMAKHLLALLAKAGVSAKVLANEPASGVMLGDLMGYTEEVRKQAEVCAKALNETGLPVVVLDSYDAEIMTQKYPEWGCEITAGVTTATAFVAKLLEEKKSAFDPRAFLPPIMDTVMYGNVPDADVAAIVDCIEKGVREVIGTLIVEFGSVGKAPLVEKVTLDEMAERYRKEGN